MRLWTIAGLTVLAVWSGLAGYDPSAAQPPATGQAAAKQKAVLLANLKRADLPRPVAVVETDHFLVAAPLSEEKTRTLAALLERVAPVARRAARFEDKEEPWKGKLAVLHLPDSRDFKSYMRNVVGSESIGTHYALRDDAPVVVDPVLVPTNATEADRFLATATTLAGAYLRAKAGPAMLPDWLTSGFARATALRAEGMTSKRYQAYRTAARTAVLGGKGNPPAALTDLWSETRPAHFDLLAASFAEYLVFGPGRDNFPKLIFAFRPDENGNQPGPAQALETAGWKDLAALEKAWQKWVATGK